MRMLLAYSVKGKKAKIKLKSISHLVINIHIIPIKSILPVVFFFLFFNVQI